MLPELHLSTAAARRMGNEFAVAAALILSLLACASAGSSIVSLDYSLVTHTVVNRAVRGMMYRVSLPPKCCPDHFSFHIFPVFSSKKHDLDSLFIVSPPFV